jgi:NADPH-dependent curcumin reductase CurA
MSLTFFSVDFNAMAVIVNEISIKGIMVSSYNHRFADFKAQMIQWNKEVNQIIGPGPAHQSGTQKWPRPWGKSD